MPARGVLLDWRGTLVRDPDDTWWVRHGLARLGRETPDDLVTPIVARLQAALELPEVVRAQRDADCSADRHRAATMLWFAEAGLDPDLAESLYEFDLEPEAHTFYDDVPGTLEVLRERGIGVAVVSDVHFDLRPEFALAGLEQLIDHFVLSFEHGIQKPDPRIFSMALDALGLSPSEALMVGDRPSRDGGAVTAGIATLLLPRERAPGALGAVLALAGS